MNPPSASSSKDRSAPTFGAVVVAAGRGARSGLNGPKQYHLLAGIPVVRRTVEALATTIEVANIMVVHHRDDGELLREALGDDLHAAIGTAIGGETRQASVHLGLQALAESGQAADFVMIHDAARPFVTEETLATLVASAHHGAGILPVLPVSETLKYVENGTATRTVPRANLAAAQTPQVFALNEILEVHGGAASATGETFTDDASIFEWAGRPVRTILGDPDNVKLTYPADFKRAERQLQMALPPQPPADIRTGYGYDVHRFADGDHVMLCGVRIPYSKRLSGHSDADVGLHALTDALLATCGAGDIGDHFPPTDPKWKGAESHIFLSEACRVVAAHGGTIINVDVTLICEAPKIGPHRQDMRERLASLTDIDIARCSVKATTNEKMGFIGRQEGMCAMATASVRFA